MTLTASEADPQLRSWRGVPIETRRAERRELLMHAAFDLLGAEGGSGVTVRGVCQAARLNPRYFYENFETLEALFIALFDRLVAEALQEAIKAVELAGPNPTARAFGVIESVVRYVTDDPKRARILFTEGLGNEEVGRRRRDTMLATARFVERFAWRQTGLAQDRIGMVASLLLVGGFTQLVAAWLNDTLEMSLEELVHDASALMATMAAGAIDVARARQPNQPSDS